MSKSADLVDQAPTEESKKDLQIIREALQQLRELGSSLPPVDAASVVRDIRESGSHPI